MPSWFDRISPAVILAVALPAVSLRVEATPRRPGWSSVSAPSRGAPRVIGRYDAACLMGAASLPLDGVGYRAVDASRRRYFGHPLLVSFVRELGVTVAARGLGTMLVGDMAQPRGGPMSFGHVSHQGGLDVDLWFRLDVPELTVAQRDGLPQPSVIDPATGRPDPARWTARQAELVRLAALDPRVSRVFVGAAIKRDLCERAWSDRRWLRLVRTWPGHDDHVHVRLRCPPGSPECIEQPPPPSGEGCAPADLEASFLRERSGLRPVVLRRSLPSACGTLLDDLK